MMTFEEWWKSWLKRCGDVPPKLPVTLSVEPQLKDFAESVWKIAQLQQQQQPNPELKRDAVADELKALDWDTGSHG